MEVSPSLWRWDKPTTISTEEFHRRIDLKLVPQPCMPTSLGKPETV